MNDDIHIPIDEPQREWKCMECGHELTATSRPGYCPDCNCTSSDTRPLNLFIQQEAHWEGSRKK